ncbi:MAG: sodium:proton exchanger [Deltaproteobacteria bacterium RBG_16_42_7]|nr:MAG: sodium:proton exchanger [Deltaproteobacteria bacterium RBG_16_42_7]
MNLLLLWLIFLGCTSAILYSGIKLSKYGDIIAEKSGLGRVWIGVILIASITSLPELVTGLSSVIIFKTPDIAAGNVLGSCVFNMLILALLDIFDKSSPISSRVQQGHTLSAGFGILLLCIVAVNIFLSTTSTGMFIALGWIGLYTPLIILFYLIAMRLIFSYEKRIIAAFIEERVEGLKYEKIPKKDVYINFSINALVVVIAALFLPGIGKEIAVKTGLGESFVGNIFIAISTTIPELVVSISALKIGAGDMAIGNLFGSNIFNITILAIDDIFFMEGPLLSFVESTHMVSAISAIIMMTIAIIGLTYRASKKQLFLSWDAIGIAAVYIFNLIVLYILR